ncbi:MULTISPECIES: substrate-binding domain-containing protein [Thalassospira]|uniref:Substrate-binding domain-containing protein n=1 Tax=Thalassospira povalilytica TaxID=732237 RepID=A0A8I1M4I9_9PROT|nr:MULTISPECIES: substrate-binding domain-containing protein [Thalassospira]RCK28233.1 phosphate ABC transporter substrate-binding protein [Thalassospira profundimaris]MAL41910.1 phosphate ABC transporter substrate-binding protein [Thalassospira sp.]MBN8195110.1 substrate-binding domain-containing protein [Thalassospira povalilytica]MBO6770545.1 substrate-binding domain-containing protein [Thalassospira sp.]HAY50060.1 phosphate ABC transporter substrate-binding protein [Thalassospira sp.]|tara:strand:- start:2287 stop:3318 length:1032 start_codon:yes stop_codon:yes gene_type:complete
MRRTFAVTAMAASIALVSVVSAAQARDQVRIVGSSTIFPLTTKVAEHFARTTGEPAPVVESTGSGGGFKLFCGGVGEQYPDIVDASRPISGSETAICAANSVRKISEIKIGYDGIVLLGSREAPTMSLTARQLYLALARTIPVNGASVPNPNVKWSDVDPSLPDLKIRVYGPPPTSGTRDLMGQLLLDKGCSTFADIASLESSDPDSFRLLCRTIREDGAYIEAGENDRLVISKLEKDPTSYGVMGFNNLERNREKLRGITINGIEPDYETILDGSYPGSRALYLYVKDDHEQLVRSLGAFVSTYVSEAVIGEDGLLVENGLVPLTEEERQETLATSKKFAAH